MDIFKNNSLDDKMRLTANAILLKSHRLKKMSGHSIQSNIANHEYFCRLIIYTRHIAQSNIKHITRSFIPYKRSCCCRGYKLLGGLYLQPAMIRNMTSELSN
jgi:hypothetical protein